VIEVVAEYAFGHDFFCVRVCMAADEFPGLRYECRRAVVGAVGRLVGIEHISPDHHLANVGMFLAGIARRGQSVSRVPHGEEIQELKDCEEQTERQKHKIERSAQGAGRLIGVAIGTTDVIKGSVGAELRHEQIEFWILGERGHCPGVKVEFVNREGGLGHSESGAIASDGGGLKDEFAGGAGCPMRSVVDGVTLGDIAHLGAVGTHDGDAGDPSFAMEDAGERILIRPGGKAAHAEVGGMEQAEFVAGVVTKQKDSANVFGREAVEELAGLASATNSSDVDANVRGVSGLASPEQTSGHEFGAGALRFPRVAVVNLGGALTDRFSEFAIDRADGVITQFEVELSLR